MFSWPFSNFEIKLEITFLIWQLAMKKSSVSCAPSIHKCENPNSLFQKTLKMTIDNAYKNYIKSRPPPSKESIKRMKERESVDVGYHPVFGKWHAYSWMNP